jgi:hypothetical protein
MTSSDFKAAASAAGRGNDRAVEKLFRDLLLRLENLSPAELAFIDGITAGQGLASKALVLDANGHVVMPAGGRFMFSNATPAAAGTTSADATVISAQVNAVTGADGAKGIALPAAADNDAIYIANTSQTKNLLVYPVNGGNDNINGLSEDAAFTMGPGKAGWFFAISATQWYAPEYLRPSLETIAVSTTLTQENHGNKTIVMGGAGAARTFTLPAATGSGAKFKFVVGAVNTSGYLIKVADNDDTIDGTILGNSTGDAATAAVLAWLAGASDDTITLDGTTTGGASIGDWVELEDIAANQYVVRGLVTQSGTEATPFSATV